MFTRGISLVAMLTLVTGSTRADVSGYVGKADSAYSWTLKGKSNSPLGTVYDIHLVSQVWQGIKWEHALQVYVPLGVTPTPTMLLLNTGGKPGASSAAFGLTVAAKVKAPVAFLFDIPNQPLFEGLKEDALIAETFVRYLESGDNNWPLLFPMTKSLVKAMDAVQAFAVEEWKQPVKGFVVTGASKRGWTTWLTAASDPRVKAIAPMVIDTLNFPAQLPHQVECFGTYSEMIGDYTKRKLVPLPDTASARKLWQMTDPYFYKEKYTMPKLILNGANDRYWTVDALNYYWDGLPGDKWVCYVPNAGHNLQQTMPDGKKDRTRSIEALTSFARCQIHNTPMPKLTWRHDDCDGKLRVSATSSAAPKTSRVWVADSTTRDFRNSKWQETPVDGMTALVNPPTNGFRACFMELDFADASTTYQLSTQIRVVEAKK